MCTFQFFNHYLAHISLRFFAFIHIRAFSYKPYKSPNNSTRTPRLYSLGHAFDFRETFREIWAGCIYILDRMRGVEPRTDVSARRMVVMEAAFGRARLKETRREPEKSFGVTVKQEVIVDIEGETQWLGVGDDYAYGLGYLSRREKSDGLEDAIEKELQRRGVRLRDSSK